MERKILAVILVLIPACAVCSSQSIVGGAMKNSHRDPHAVLQQQIAVKANHGNGVNEQIRDDGFGQENLNSPVVGGGCVTTDSHPCPQVQPPPQKVPTAKVPTAKVASSEDKR